MKRIRCEIVGDDAFEIRRHASYGTASGYAFRRRINNKVLNIHPIARIEPHFRRQRSPFPPAISTKPVLATELCAVCINHGESQENIHKENETQNMNQLQSTNNRGWIPLGVGSFLSRRTLNLLPLLVLFHLSHLGQDHFTEDGATGNFA